MATYKIDLHHSQIKFRVKHLMITNVTGEFKQFDATLEAKKEDFSDAKISFEADIDSISTHNEQRDAHLKGEDFFNAAEYPKLSFVSKELKNTSGDKYQLKGDLTIKGITKEVVLEAELGGTVTDPWGQFKAGFEIEGKISRKDFGLTWNATTEAGGVVVSDEVKLSISAQMVKQNEVSLAAA